MAQVEASATRGSAPFVVGGTFSYFDTGYASNRMMGVGAFIDWSPMLAGNLGVEGEGRWLTFNGANDLNEYSYLVGPRYRFYVSHRFQPYAKMLVGAGEIDFPYHLAHGGYFALAPGGGLDFESRGRWRLRADYEYQVWLNSPGIPGVQSSAIKPNGVSVGISYRLFR